jgi:hypothetical protein
VTRNEQIRKAMELLAPPPGRRAECQHDIGVALDRVEHGAAAAHSFQVARSKAGKAGVRRYCSALRRVRTAYQSLDPAIILLIFSTPPPGHVADGSCPSEH